MPETITLPYPSLSVELIIYMVGAAVIFLVPARRIVRGINKTPSSRTRVITEWALCVLLLPLIPATCGTTLAFAILEKQAEADAKIACIESIPEEWNAIIEVLHSEEIRTPAKMILVREHVEGQILPDLTIKQQNHIVETTFVCKCGCSENCERNRDELSELIAVYVNAFPGG